MTSLPPDPATTHHVGRLLPLPGVVRREHPDRDLLLRFLDEVQLPLAAMRSLLEVSGGDHVAAAVGDHVDHVLGLCADFRACATIEAGVVTPAPTAVDPIAWFDGVLAEAMGRAVRLGLDLQPLHRSFLPDRLVFDGTLAARAVAAVLAVAMQRALPGAFAVRVAYVHDPRTTTASRLILELDSRGGGFGELEQGYLFRPFAVRDPGSRPWLGLSVGQALCALLGGTLVVHSPTLGHCRYTLSFQASPAPGSQWLDPLAHGRAVFGPVG